MDVWHSWAVGVHSVAPAQPLVFSTLCGLSVTGLGQEQVEVDIMFRVQVVESKCGMAVVKYLFLSVEIGPTTGVDLINRLP